MTEQIKAARQAETEQFKAARQADARAAMALFEDKLARLWAEMAALDDVSERAGVIGANEALMEGLQHCAAAEAGMRQVVRDMSCYLVAERGQTKQAVAGRAGVTPLTMGRWTKADAAR